MKVHSVVGIITNSSTELFTFVGRRNIKSLTELGELLGGKIEVRPTSDIEESYTEAAKEFIEDLGTWGEYEKKEIEETLKAKDWEYLWSMLIYSYSIPYPYNVFWIKDGKETDITSLLLDCVEAVECGNGN